MNKPVVVMTDQDMDALVDNIVNSMSSAAVHQTLAVLDQANHAYYQYQAQCATSAAKQHLKQLVQCVNAPAVTSMPARCLRASHTKVAPAEPVRQSERVKDMNRIQLQKKRDRVYEIEYLLTPFDQFAQLERDEEEQLKLELEQLEKEIKKEEEELGDNLDD